ncbi:MAG: THUMP domain-containing protein [Candidatus Bathyarchaeia archaeon]
MGFGGSFKTKYLAYVSAEHPTLPSAELKALLEAEDVPFHVEERLPGILLIESPRPVEEVAKSLKRASMMKALYRLILDSQLQPEELKREVDGLEPPAEKGGTFSLRVNRAPTLSVKVDTARLEHLIGDLLRRKMGWSVDLKNPQVWFQGFALPDRILLGLNLYRRPLRAFESREPGARPRFHPATLTPKLARCMVNLSRARTGHLLLDPFCGVGGVLIEAGLIGCQVIGVDAQRRMCEGCLENLRHYGVNALGVLWGDALHLPVSQVDRVVADPPYGTAASTMKRSMKTLLEGFMPQCASILTRDGFACLAAPLGLGLANIGSAAGLTPVENHQIYVHRRLTREIVVFKKP